MVSGNASPLDAADLSLANFIDLIHLADADAALLPRIRNDYMIAKYGVDRTEHCFDCPHPSNGSSVRHQIPLNDYPTAEKYLRLFGDLVTRMSFWQLNRVFVPEQIAALVRLIEHRSSESLETLTFHGSSFGHLTGDTHQTFPNVHHITMFRISERDNCDLVRAYPRLRKLSCDILTLSSVETLVRAHHSLTEFQLFTATQSLLATNLKRFIELNPQIRSFSVDHFPNSALLQFISVKLAKLEYLSVAADASSPTEYDAAVHFANVKHLVVSEMRHCHCTLPLTFDRLQSVTFYDIDRMAEDEVRTLLFRLPAIGTSEERSAGTIPAEWNAAQVEQLGMRKYVRFARKPASASAVIADMFKAALKLADRAKERLGKQ